MKMYTQEEFNAMPVVDGWKQCPAGDYTQIKAFGGYCSFGKGCSFEEWCSFGKGCIFEEWCNFGKGCSFEIGCIFEEWCNFGKGCSFEVGCSFEEWCSFGERCSFGAGCVLEGVVMLGYLQVGPIGSRNGTTLFIKHAEGVRVRCGCFAGEMDEFAVRVSETHKDDKYGKQYMAAIVFARAVLGEGLE